MTTTPESKKKVLPITLLSGFLGSGKTSLLKHILSNKQGIRVAVIVNEITEENIDAYALGGSKLLQQDEKFIEIPNGCICCVLRKELVAQLRELSASGMFDAILIESSGISEPMQVAQTFVTDQHDGEGLLNDVAQLDTCVTVVDATSMMDRLKDEVRPDKPLGVGLENVQNFSKKEVDEEGNPRNIGQLMAEQIEYANVVILNKIDRFATKLDENGQPFDLEKATQNLITTVKQLNPSATVIPAQYCKVDLKEVLGTGKCTLEFSQSIRGWMTDLGDDHTPETEEYGVRNFVFRSNRPFHPLRLHQWITSLYILEEMVPDDEDDDDEKGSDDDSSSCSSSDDSNNNKIKIQKPKKKAVDASILRKNRIEKYGGEIFRCKGFMWVGNPSRLGFFVSISAAGEVMSFLPGGGWGTFPVRGGTGTTQVEPSQRLAFLGQYLNREKLQKDLEELLLTEDEEKELKQSMIQAAALAAAAKQKKSSSKKKKKNSGGGDEPPADIFDDPFEPFGRGGEEEHH